MKTIIIDNYDSYTYNLVHLVWTVSDVKPIVIKNDELNYSEFEKLDFDNIIISPGPGRPDNEKDFGICKNIIEKSNKPILGVCLGHQGIASIFGSKVVKANEAIHGRTSLITHNGKDIFHNIPSPFKVMRYHSLIAKDLSDSLEVTATTNDGIIMALKHKTKNIYGVQFHPESIATEYGKNIIENFNEITKNQKPFITSHSIHLNIEDNDLFETLYKKDKNLMWLDSSKIVKNDSRYSIFGLSSKRSHTLKYYSKDKKIIISGNENKTIEQSIFDYMDEFLKENENNLNTVFSLGYIGYLGYEIKGECTGEYKYDINYPDAMFKFVDRAVIKDHLTNEITFVYYSDDKFEIEDISYSNLKYCNKPFPNINLEVNKIDYINDIKKSIDYIQDGESYEICLTNRIIIDEKINAVDYYKFLRKVSPGQYSSLLLFDDIQICSSSMERYLRINSDKIVDTKPIKGTLPRGKNKEEDEKFISDLKNNERFHSENLMIVDLLRNDLGIICEKNSVKVKKLLDVETYETLHQLVSTVEGKISENNSIMDCVKSTFPGGSMTGSPKKRTLEIIDKLEKSPRGVYSGTIGYFSLNQNVDLSIVIRTSVIEESKTTIGVGGAIINLSDPYEEYDEILLKASGSLNALNEYYGK